MLRYKGYTGYAEFDDEADVFFGRVVNANAVVTFRGSSVKELKQRFKESVDFYIETCRKKGIEPAKPYSGRLNLRLDPETHRRATEKALSKGKSLNSFIRDAIAHEIQA